MENTDNLFELYVSPNGSDENDGGRETPLKSVQKALKRLEGKGGTVNLLEGVYRVLGSVEIGPANSGVTIKGVGSKTVLDGSVPLDAGKFMRLCDAQGERFASKVRVNDCANAHVWVYDLKADNLNAGRIYKNGFNWPLMPCNPELVVDGKLQKLASWPKGDPLTRHEILIGREIKGRENNHTSEEHERYLIAMHSGARQGGIPRQWYFDKCDTPKTYEEMLALDAPIFYAASDELRGKAARWLPKPGQDGDDPKYETDAFLSGYFENNYADDMSFMRAFDYDKRLLYLKQPVMQGVQDFWLKLRAVNVLGELTQPGEYYIDRFNGNDILYYYPEGDRPQGEISLTSLSTPVFRLEGAKNVKLTGLCLKNGTGNGMELIDCEDCEVSDCEICNFSLDAVRIGKPGATITADPTYTPSRGGHRITVTGCYVHDMGGGGVYMAGGDRRTLERGDHVTEKCEFYRLSNKRTYSPAVYLEGVGNVARNNYIHSSPHMSVHIMGNNMLVEANFIENVCQNTSDQGAIYAGRCYSWLGNVISGNVVRGVGGRDNHGVYLDDGMSGVTVRGNVFEDVSGHCLFLNSGHSNTVEDNVFVCENSAIRLWGLEAKRPISNEKTLRYRWEAMMSPRFNSEENIALWRRHYTEIYPYFDKLYFPDDDSVFPEDENCLFAPSHHIFRRNIIVGGGDLHNGKPETMKYYGDDFGQPLYRCPEKSEVFESSTSYAIKPDCAVSKAGGFEGFVGRFNASITHITPDKEVTNV